MADRPGEAGPVDPPAFASALAPLLTRRPAGLVVAVSGGPDSMGLMGLVAEFARHAALPPPAVATVDHGLRDGSRADADFVLGEAQALGLPAHRLAWTGAKPVRAVQEKAREARYRLLAALCRQLGADHLLTAHTLDDQAETVLLRLAHGSGPAGLAGMRATASLAPGVTLLRPLLAFSKARLIATCAARGWASRHDPSNDDPRFARTRLRRLMPALAAEGLTADAIARAAARLGRAEAALEHATAEIGRHALRTAGPGVRQLDLGRLAALPPDFTIRLLGEAVGAAGPDGPRIRLDRLEQAGEALRAAAAAGAPLRRTLGGCLLRLDAAGLLTIGREGPRRRGAGPSGEARGAASPVKPNGGASLGKGPLDPYIAR